MKRFVVTMLALLGPALVHAREDGKKFLTTAALMAGGGGLTYFGHQKVQSDPQKKIRAHYDDPRCMLSQVRDKALTRGVAHDILTMVHCPEMEQLQGLEPNVPYKGKAHTLYVDRPATAIDILGLYSEYDTQLKRVCERADAQLADNEYCGHGNNFTGASVEKTRFDFLRLKNAAKKLISADDDYMNSLRNLVAKRYMRCLTADVEITRKGDAPIVPKDVVTNHFLQLGDVLKAGQMDVVAQGEPREVNLTDDEIVQLSVSMAAESVASKVMTSRKETLLFLDQTTDANTRCDLLTKRRSFETALRNDSLIQSKTKFVRCHLRIKKVETYLASVADSIRENQYKTVFIPAEYALTTQPYVGVLQRYEDAYGTGREVPNEMFAKITDIFKNARLQVVVYHTGENIPGIGECKTTAQLKRELEKRGIKDVDCIGVNDSDNQIKMPCRDIPFAISSIADQIPNYSPQNIAVLTDCGADAKFLRTKGFMTFSPFEDFVERGINVLTADEKAALHQRDIEKHNKYVTELNRRRDDAFRFLISMNHGEGTSPAYRAQLAEKALAHDAFIDCQEMQLKYDLSQHAEAYTQSHHKYRTPTNAQLEPLKKMVDNHDADEIAIADAANAMRNLHGLQSTPPTEYCALIDRYNPKYCRPRIMTPQVQNDPLTFTPVGKRTFQFKDAQPSTISPALGLLEAIARNEKQLDYRVYGIDR